MAQKLIIALGGAIGAVLRHLTGKVYMRFFGASSIYTGCVSSEASHVTQYYALKLIIKKKALPILNQKSIFSSEAFRENEIEFEFREPFKFMPMLIIKKTAIILFLFLSISCTKPNPNFNPTKVTEFGTPAELQGVQLFEDVLGKATFTLIDSLILFSTRDDDMFQVYDLNENHISSFGRQGNGPGEYTRQPFFRDANSFIKNGNDHILFYDESNDMTGVELDVTASIKENEVVIAKEFKLPEKFSYPAISLFHIDSETYLGRYGDQFFQQFDGKEGGWYYSPEDTNITTFAMYNLHMEPFDAIPESNLNIRYLGVSPDRSKFATALMYAPVVEIFDMYSTEPLQIQVTDKPFPPTAPFTPDDFNEQNLTEYFRSIYTSNEYIYLLYTGKELSESGKEQFVKIIDWEGNPVQQYSIPAEYNINLFQVDVENNQLYGLSWNNDAVYRFDL